MLIIRYLTNFAACVAIIVLPHLTFSQPAVDSILKLIRTETNNDVKAQNYCKIANFFIEPDSAIKYSLLSIDYSTDKESETVAQAYFQMSMQYYLMSESEKALNYMRKAIVIFEKKENMAYVAKCYSMMSNCYEDLCEYDSIFLYTNKAMKIAMEIGDTVELVSTYCNIGRAYANLGLHESAAEYYMKAFRIDSISGNMLDVAADCYFLGSIYGKEQQEYEKGKKYLQTAVRLFETIESEDPYHVIGKYNSYSELAELYINMAQKNNNEKYADSCLMNLVNVGDFYLQQKEYSNYLANSMVYVQYYYFYEKYADALLVLLECEKYITTTIPNSDKSEFHRRMADVYQRLGNYKKAFEHQAIQFQYERKGLNDSTLRVVSNSQIEQALMIEKLEQKRVEELHQAEKHQMHVIIISLILGLSMVALLAVVMSQLFRVKRRASIELSNKNNLLAKQKEEIANQNMRLIDQNTQLERQNEKIENQQNVIQASINYAHLIQKALLPPEATVNQIFPNNFIVYLPKNVVSGDFFWVGQFGDNKVCVVADCTGHGVPGGFMSMLGITNLNYIVEQELKPDKVLNKLREAIIKSLRQHNSVNIVDVNDGTTRSRDGIDMIIYVVNEKLKKLSFAGANNPLVLIRNNEEILLKPDKMPIGIFARMKPFGHIDIDLCEGDCLYAFSDGYQDQFGIKTGQKFMSSNLHKLLLEIHQLPMNEQKEILVRRFEEWRGPIDNQTDDVLLMGVRF